MSPAAESVGFVGAASHAGGHRIILRKVGEREIGDMSAREISDTRELSVELMGAFHAHAQRDLAGVSGILPVCELAHSTHGWCIAQRVDQVDLLVAFLPSALTLPWPVVHAEYRSGVVCLLHAGEVAMPEERLTG